jgi:hypothetical protein
MKSTVKVYILLIGSCYSFILEALEYDHVFIRLAPAQADPGLVRSGYNSSM